MPTKLIITFETLNQPAFLAKAELITTSLASNPHFPTPWPDKVPAPADLTAAFNAYQTLAYAAESRDTAKIAGRNAARADLTIKLKKAASYLELIADGDAAILQTTGYDLRHPRPTRSEAAVLPAPENLRVKRGPLSGSLSLRMQPVKGAGSYEVQLSTADPGVEANWKAGTLSKKATQIELTGLMPGTTYHVRARAIGTRGPGAWAQSPGVMVV